MAEKPVAAADTSPKERIIAHMNKDHQDSLIRYLEYFCHLSSFSARHARLSDITFDHLVISTYAGSSHIIPIHPSMTSWSEARPRVVAMDAEAVAGLDRSNITVKKYTRPTGYMLGVFCLVLLNLIIFPRRQNFLPGSLLYDNLWVYVPGFAWFCLRMRPLVLFLIFTIHPAEAIHLHRSRLRKHTVPTFSVLWWKWILSNVIEGFPAFVRFDRIVEEEERKRANARH